MSLHRRSKAFGAVLAGYALVAAWITFVALANATPSSRNDRIVFLRLHENPARSEIVVANLAGGGERTVARAPRGFEDDQPDWASDGARVAFSRCPTGVTGRCGVVVVRADGTRRSRLSPDCQTAPPTCEDRFAPAWSPVRNALAFAREWGPVSNDQIKHSELFVADASGSGVRQLTHLTTTKPFSVGVGASAWSPDGRHLVFQVQNSARTTPANGRALFVINADGSGLHRLTPWSLNAGGGPDWSPDGKRILFRSVSAADHLRGDIYTIRPDGTELRRLTNLSPAHRVLLGSYSPNGRSIVLATDATAGVPDIHLMDADGTNLRRVTNSNSAEDSPDWGQPR
jgi:TolB protein